MLNRIISAVGDALGPVGIGYVIFVVCGLSFVGFVYEPEKYECVMAESIGYLDLTNRPDKGIFRGADGEIFCVRGMRIPQGVRMLVCEPHFPCNKGV